MGRKISCRSVALFVATGAPLILSHPVLADTPAGVSNVENFIKSVITTIVSIVGLVAVGFFVVGGFGYITSSGNPEHLDRSKKTLIYSAVGLSIAIAAFVIGNIVTTLATNAFGS
jgi:hypothetical protein